MEIEFNIFEQNGAGVIELDRPKALNSLSREMIDAIFEAADKWQHKDSIDRVLIVSTAQRAFCAGGDVRKVAEDDAAGHYGPGDEFFDAEYNLNRRLATYGKPVIAVIGGVVMGGGFGVSAHGSHRVITPDVMGAMPEAAIGFVPDVGMTYRLTHLEAPESTAEQLPRGETLGVFLGTTGWRMNAADMLATGLATHLVREAQPFINDVIAKGLGAALREHAWEPEAALNTRTLQDSPSRILAHAKVIEEIFGDGDWLDIEARLNAFEPEGEDAEAFVADVKKALANGNPTSLVATTEIMRRSAHTDLATALRNEMVVGHALRRQPNFPEGVRAVLVDKDQSPNFDPARAEDVNREDWVDLLD